MAPTIPIDYTGQREAKNLSKIGLGDMNGKTRKVSKGYSAGFVPDYRHAVETMAESEDLGSSGRVDMDFANSEDYFGRKRKRLGMEVGGSDQFGVPSQVLSLSKMSRGERRDWEMRLTKELQQVRMFQSKIASLYSVPVAEPPGSAMHGYQNGSQRAAVTGSFPRTTNSASFTASGKKKGAAGKNSARTKGGASVPRTTESVTHDLPHNINFFAPVMKSCRTLLTQMMGHQHGWVFNEPVDTEKLKIPDYFTIIKHPMDLGTIKKKLLSGQYSHPTGFAEDVRLTFRNAMTYNPAGHDVHAMAGILSKFFEMRWKPIAKKIPAAEGEPATLKSRVTIEAESVAPPVKKQKSTPVVNRSNQELDQMVMSDVDKQKLSEELVASLEDLPGNIIEFLKRSNGNQADKDEIEIDLDALGDNNLFILRKLLDDYMLEKQRNQAKVGHCEIEMGSVSGFSNLSAQPPKENEPADEDVDIEGDDPPPISSSSPVEIDKDITRRNSSSSSSGSSSDSGSSSSETDSGNSLGGELVDDAKNSSPADKEANSQLEQKETDCSAATRDPSDGHSEHLPSNSSLIEPNPRQEGENAPADREVSPDKNYNYRAALLKSRFADIIIKAQENTNEMGERTNSEKLKFEREEVERRRREEKARLQAEAKAAEEARKKAEQEAAAEAKRKRELEREAARLALQQMEKTVEINESSQFMEDLELFRAGPEEHIVQGFVEDASPENSRDCLGSFKFEASTNPLEQLGLYMKNDDDEDEEVELQSIPGTSNDPEEGEID